MDNWELQKVNDLLLLKVRNVRLVGISFAALPPPLALNDIQTMDFFLSEKNTFSVVHIR